MFISYFPNLHPDSAANSVPGAEAAFLHPDGSVEGVPGAEHAFLHPEHSLISLCAGVIVII